MFFVERKNCEIIVSKGLMGTLSLANEKGCS